MVQCIRDLQAACVYQYNHFISIQLYLLSMKQFSIFLVLPVLNLDQYTREFTVHTVQTYSLDYLKLCEFVELWISRSVLQCFACSITTCWVRYRLLLGVFDVRRLTLLFLEDPQFLKYGSRFWKLRSKLGYLSNTDEFSLETQKYLKNY